MPCLSRPLARLSIVAVTIWLWATLGAAVAALNSQEQALAERVINDSNQGRAFVTIDETLSAVARAKAADMANREYFAHTDPDGYGANYLVRQAGYSLPSHYSTAPSGNNIESLAAGYASVSSVWSGWMGSADHKRHILGETDFFAEQTSLGVGYYEKAGSPYRYYWVIITAPPSGARLTIASPAANVTLNTADVTVKGTTSGAPAADRVEVRVENANGNSSYVVASGRTSWNVTVSGLAAGSNVLRVRSLDASGSVLKEATRTVKRVLLEELTVAVSGSGYVSKGYAGATQREVGRQYTIGAAANAGWIFSHWSGGEYSTSSKITVTMRAGLELTANFVPNPFLARTGAYHGLLHADSAQHATSGIVKVSLVSSGAVTGKLLLGSKTYAFTAKLNLYGDATVTIPRPGLSPLTVSLDLDVDGDSDRVTGSVTDGSFSASFEADRGWQTSTQARSSIPGRYTVVLPPSGDASLPEGAGWAVLTVSSTGVASLSGKLADGAAISVAALVSKDGLVSIFQPLYSSLGSISGSLTFRTTSISDLDGTLYWHKPERPTTPRYPAAFSAEHQIVGSRYTAPASGGRVIALEAAAGNGLVTLEDGDLEAGLSQVVTVGATNVVKAVAPVQRGFTATIKAANGSFGGTFTDPALKVTRSFTGVFLQKQNAGFGFFLGAAESGLAQFTPAE